RIEEANRYGFESCIIEVRSKKVDVCVVLENALALLFRLKLDPFIRALQPLLQLSVADLPFSVKKIEIRVRGRWGRNNVEILRSWCRDDLDCVFVCHNYLTLSDTLNQFHSQVLPSSGENAWLQTGRSLSRASQRNIMMI